MSDPTPREPAPSEPTDVGSHVRRDAGDLPDRGRLQTARLLAAGLAGVALFSMLPAALEWVARLRADGALEPSRWAIVLCWLGMLQIAYAVYLAQLPDWSSVWVVALVSLAQATMYAMVLGLTFVSRADSPLIGWLELADQIQGGRAAGWCFIMLCLSSLCGYVSGHISIRWQTKGGRMKDNA